MYLKIKKVAAPLLAIAKSNPAKRNTATISTREGNFLLGKDIAMYVGVRAMVPSCICKQRRLNPFWHQSQTIRKGIHLFDNRKYNVNYKLVSLFCLETRTVLSAIRDIFLYT